MTGPVFKPDLNAEPWAPIAKEARARWRRVTPYRLGYLAGLRNPAVLNPYHLPLPRNAFKRGFDYGREERKKP